MEEEWIIVLGILIPCLTIFGCFWIVYCFKYRLKKMEFEHKETLEDKRTAKKQEDELVENIKVKVLESIKDQVKETVDNKFEGGLTERVKKLEEQIKK